MENVAVDPMLKPGLQGMIPLAGGFDPANAGRDRPDPIGPNSGGTHLPLCPVGHSDSKKPSLVVLGRPHNCARRFRS